MSSSREMDDEALLIDLNGDEIQVESEMLHNLRIENEQLRAKLTKFQEDQRQIEKEKKEFPFAMAKAKESTAEFINIEKKVNVQDKEIEEKKQIQRKKVLESHLFRIRFQKLAKVTGKITLQNYRPLKYTFLRWFKIKNEVVKYAEDLKISITHRNQNAALLKIPLTDQNKSLKTFGGNFSHTEKFVQAIQDCDLKTAESLLPLDVTIKNIAQIIFYGVNNFQARVELLWWSILNKHEDVAIWLLQHGANPNTRAPLDYVPSQNLPKLAYGMSPLIYLTRNNVNLAESKLAQELLTQKADVDMIEPTGHYFYYTALHWAIHNNHIGNVKFLCEKNANPTIAFHNTCNALTYAKVIQNHSDFPRSPEKQKTFDQIVGLLENQYKLFEEATIRISRRMRNW